MDQHNQHLRILLLITSSVMLFLLLTGTGIHVSYTQTSNCIPREQWQGWAKNSTVGYCFDSNLSSDQRTGIQNAITAWNSANQSNSSGVSFQVSGTGVPCKLTFKNATLNFSGSRASVQTTNGATTSATIKFDLNANLPNSTMKWWDPTASNL